MEQKALLNPFAGVVDREVMDWADRIGFFESPEERESVRRQQLNKFASRMYPNADFGELLPITKLFLTLFCLDDRADSLQGMERSRYWKKVRAGYGRCPVGKDHLDGDPMPETFTEILWDWGGKNPLSPDRGRKLKRLVWNFIRAGHWESVNLSKGLPPSINSYLRQLKHSSGAGIAMDLLLYIKNNGFGHDIFYHPALKPLQSTIVLLICLSNDLASCNKEEKAGDFHNMVLLEEYHYLISREEAGQRVKSEYLFLKKAYIRQEQEYLSKAPGSRQQKQAVCDALRTLLIGCQTWAKEDTVRYVRSS